MFGVTKFCNYLLGCIFTLLRDYRPFFSLLSEDKPILFVAAARIQRRALILSAYAYKIKYRQSNLHGNANACNRLPLKVKFSDPPELVKSVLLIHSLNDSPLTAHSIRRAIERYLISLQAYIHC